MIAIAVVKIDLSSRIRRIHKRHQRSPSRVSTKLHV